MPQLNDYTSKLNNVQKIEEFLDKVRDSIIAQETPLSLDFREEFSPFGAFSEFYEQSLANQDVDGNALLIEAVIRNNIAAINEHLSTNVA